MRSLSAGYPVLTEGDQLELPVTVRNYLSNPQKAEITLAPNNWSMLQGPKVRVMELPANSSANVSYSMKAMASKEKATRLLASPILKLKRCLRERSQVN